MEIVQASERIQRLEKRYENNEIHQNEWDCFREGRVRLEYNRGYLKSNALTTLRRKTDAEVYWLSNMRPVIEEDEIIVGAPDMHPLNEAESRELEELEQKMAGLTPVMAIGGHMALDFEILLKKGISGLLFEIEKYTEQKTDGIKETARREFYDCVAQELRAVCNLADRYAEHAGALAEKATGKRKEELLELERIMHKVPRFPAETFWEAVESIHFYMFTLHNLFYYGRIDQYLWPYYEKDMRTGRLTREFAQELIDSLFLIPAAYNGHSSATGATVGGRTPEGRLADNAITEMVLISCAHCRLCDNLIGFSVTKETDDKLLRLAVRLNILTQKPLFFCEEKITAGFMRYGLSLEEARTWCNTGCVLTLSGRYNGYGIGEYYNLLEPLLSAMQELPQSFADFLRVYEEKLREKITDGIRKTDLVMLEQARNGFEVMRVSALVKGCLENGAPLEQSGGRYSFSQVNFVGFANAADSVNAIRTLVYEEKRISMQQFLKVLEENFAEDEKLLAEIKGIRKYGEKDCQANRMAQAVAETVSKACDGLKNCRGGQIIPGLFSYIWHAEFGAGFGATPDGRKKGEAFSSCAAPVSNMETEDLTETLGAVASWEQERLPVSPSYCILLKKGETEAEDKERLENVIRMYFEKGGAMLEPSVVDTKKLAEAACDLTGKGKEVRVGLGAFCESLYNMNKLSPYLLQEVLGRKLY